MVTGASASHPSQRKAAGHRQRLRDKFLAHGLAKFTDEELLELLLTLGTPRRDCKEIARGALKTFGSLRQVLEADLSALQAVQGIGPNNAFGLKLIHEVGRKFLEERLIERDYLTSSRQVFEYLHHSMRDLKREVFKVIFLNSRNQVLAVEDLFEGSLTSSAIYPREVIQRSLHHNASTLVFAHNHASGDILPSRQDKKATRDLVFVARVMGMRVLDHIIVGSNNDYFSFAETGLIKEYERLYAVAQEAGS
jgi:DNA repair protein RadC